MKTFFTFLSHISKLISLIIFVCGVVLLCVAIYDFLHSILLLWEEYDPAKPIKIAIGMLKTIDFLLIAIVFFIFSLGTVILFSKKSQKRAEELAVLPDWLQVKNFTELKIILWEAILTTFIVTYIADLTLYRLTTKGLLQPNHLILPGAVFLLALSLFLLKKRED